MRSNDSTSEAARSGELTRQLQTAIETTFASIVLPFEGVEVEAAESDDAVRIRATVTFEGDLEGHVLIHCSLGGAHDISRGMLMLEEGDPLELSDVVDAMGECANLVAGVLKRNALDAAGTVRMSCPSVEIEGAHQAFPTPDAQLAYKLVRGVSAAEVWLKKSA